MNVRTISVIVPCRNEQDHIEAFCKSVAAQQVPAGCQLEVILADGMSDDGTRERFHQWHQRYLQKEKAPDASLHFDLIDNPGRIVSSGLNQCIARSMGVFLVRLDVHTVYAPDYIAQCWAAWQHTGADNVGGPWRAEGQPGPQGTVQRAIAAAFQSRWVAGGARSRDLTYNGPVDTVYLGAWPRTTFDRFGGFDEQLMRNQDDEHNLRIHLAGGRIWQSASIRSTYFPRAQVSDVFRQYRQYGYWKPFVMHKHGQAAALRHVVPSLFVGTWCLGLLALMLIGACLANARLGAWTAWFFYGVASLWLLQTGVYALAVMLVSRGIARQHEWALLRYLPNIIAAYHVGYGLGSLRGWWDVLVRRRPDPAFGRLTRPISSL
jgi:glycosyltransferase involved in cell wall biosynthesis